MINEVPDVRFHIKRDGKFLCFDRHGDSDDFFFGDFNNPFLCSWDSIMSLLEYKLDGDEVCVSINNDLK